MNVERHFGVCKIEICLSFLTLKFIIIHITSQLINFSHLRHFMNLTLNYIHVIKRPLTCVLLTCLGTWIHHLFSSHFLHHYHLLHHHLHHLHSLMLDGHVPLLFFHKKKNIITVTLQYFPKEAFIPNLLAQQQHVSCSFKSKRTFLSKIYWLWYLNLRVP